MIKKHIDLIIVAFVVLSLVMYDVTFDLFLGLAHLVFAMLHNLFEWVELGIEHAVEHLFHTGRHASQVVTFYILWLIAGFGFYRLWKTLPRLYRFFKQLALEAWVRRKTQLELYWQSLTPLHKAAVVATAMGVAYIASFFVM